jgi:hypothetical protein
MNCLSSCKKKDQNIVQAMSLLTDVKARLVTLRHEGWEPYLKKSNHFMLQNIFQSQTWMSQYQDGADQGLMGT